MQRKILVLNTGSSSIKFALYDGEKDALLLKGQIDRLGTPQARLLLRRFYASPNGIGEAMEETPTRIKDLHTAIPFILDLFLKEKALNSLKEISAVGHRVVHGAETYREAVLVTDTVLKEIDSLSRYAPLHNPFNLEGIKRCAALLLGVPNVVIFDTAFHQSLEPKVFLYGIPTELYEKYGLRKYGFHGTNHKYCSLRAAELLGKMPHRMVTCHLGNGSSVTAIRDGLSADTSMGFTPIQGLIMGTRCGAVDPGIVIFLAKHKGIEAAERFLNNESGLKGIAGSGDVRDLWRRAQQNDPDAKLALDMFGHRVAHYVGAYAALLDGLDCLSFSGGIGENAWYVRKAVCDRFVHLGLQLDDVANMENRETISKPGSKVKVLVIRANEELQIGRETKSVIGPQKPPQGLKTTPH